MTHWWPELNNFDRYAAGTRKVVDAIKAIAPPVAFDVATAVLQDFDNVRGFLVVIAREVKEGMDGGGD
jgi:hypothetical protein